MPVRAFLRNKCNCHAAFGFLGGREAEEAGSVNVGLYDRMCYECFYFCILISSDVDFHLERLALHWVKKYISQFGGDPDRVTV
jgi:acetylcholinesterase